MTAKYKVGLIAGTFDIIHPGYIEMFKDAKTVCDYLVVALHVDPSVERPKTKFKPIFNSLERIEILMAIKYVDSVLLYETEKDLVGLILEIKPDVRILGTDYGSKQITGRLMTPIYYHKRTHDWSATKVRELICEAMNRRAR